MKKTDQFNRIYQDHAAKVLKLCKGYFYGDEDQASDAVQEVFINIWQHLDTFRNESSVSTWIYRITVNTCLLHLRKLSGKKEIRTPVVPETADTSYSYEEERLQQMYACIRKLDESNKVIILLVLEGVEYKEIANVIGISEETLRVKIYRIKKNLTNCVQHGNV